MRKAALAVVLIVVAVAGGWWWLGRDQAPRVEPGAAATETGGAAPARGVAEGAPASTDGRLEGRLRDAGGLALAGGLIQVTRDDDDDFAPQVVAADDGTFLIAALPAGRYRVVGSAPGFLPVHDDAVAISAGATTRLELALTPGGTPLTGVVADVSGGPIVGAAVVARPRRLLGASAPLAVALTDGDGRYRLSLVPGPYVVEASHAEYVSASAVTEIGAVAQALDLALVPGGVIEGIVRDRATGDPVAGAQIDAQRERAGPRFGGRQRAHARAGSDGRFRLAGLSPGAMRVEARVDGDGRRTREPTLVPLGIAEQATGIELWVEAAPYLAGQIVDEHGVGIARAEVTAMGKGGSEQVTADGAGQFRVFGLEPGRYRLTGAAPGYLTGPAVEATMAATTTTGVVIRLATAPRVIGRVEPATAATIRVDPAQEVTSLSPGTWRMAAGTTTADDGTFELTSLAPGPHTLEAKAADGRRGTAVVEAPTAGEVTVVIQLADAGSIAGEVRDQHGAPLPGVGVQVRSAGPVQRTVMINGQDVTADKVITAADGSFRVRGLAAGPYALAVLDAKGGRLRRAGGKAADADAPTNVTLGANEQKQGVVLTVEFDDGVIRGVVTTADGTPKADAWVTATLRPEELAGRGAADDAPGQGPRSTSTTVMVIDDGDGGLAMAAPVLTDDQGRFEVRGLRRGRYDLVAEAERGALRGRAERVETGAAARIALAPLGSLVGTVTAGGQPVADFTVAVDGVTTRQQTFHGVDGAFEFKRVDPGPYQITVTSPQGSGTATATVGAGPTQLAIALAADGTVRGRLVDAAGAPVAGVPVVAIPPPSGDSISVQLDGMPEPTGSDGGFTLTLAAGRYQLITLGGGVGLLGAPFTLAAGQALDVGAVSAKPPERTPPPAP